MDMKVRLIVAYRQEGNATLFQVHADRIAEEKDGTLTIVTNEQMKERMTLRKEQIAGVRIGYNTSSAGVMDNRDFSINP